MSSEVILTIALVAELSEAIQYVPLKQVTLHEVLDPQFTYGLSDITKFF